MILVHRHLSTQKHHSVQHFDIGILRPKLTHESNINIKTDRHEYLTDCSSRLNEPLVVFDEYLLLCWMNATNGLHNTQ